MLSKKNKESLLGIKIWIKYIFINFQQNLNTTLNHYLLQQNHSFDWEKTRILDKESNYSKRIISEMINIKKQKNGINLNKDTESLDAAYFDIIKKIK